jgi:hypothetical protein
MTDETLERIDELIRWTEELATVPGPFRVSTQGHVRREQLRQSCYGLMKRLPKPIEPGDVDSAIRVPLGDLTLAEGRHYVHRVIRQIVRFLQSLRRALLVEGDSVTSSLVRMDAIEQVPVSLWHMTWQEFEHGAALLKDACEELEEGDTEERGDGQEGEGDEFEDRTKKRQSQLRMTVLMALKLLKSVVRKLKTRCLQPLIEPVESTDVIDWLDDLLEAVGPLFALIDDLVIAVAYQVHGSATFLSYDETWEVKLLMLRLAELAGRLIDAGLRFPGAHQANDTYTKVATPDSQLMQWLEQTRGHLDRLVTSVVDSVPNR